MAATKVKRSNDPQVIAIAETLQKKVEEAAALFFPGLEIEYSENANSVYNGRVSMSGWVKFSNRKSLWITHSWSTQYILGLGANLKTQLELRAYTKPMPGEKVSHSRFTSRMNSSLEEITPTAIWEAYQEIVNESGMNIF